MATSTQNTFEDIVRDLYNAIMYEIEPELMTSNIGDLDLEYKNETSDEREIRKKRYEIAFAEAEKRISEFLRIWKGDLYELQKLKMSQLQSSAADEDKSILDSLEQKFI